MISTCSQTTSIKKHPRLPTVAPQEKKTSVATLKLTAKAPENWPFGKSRNLSYWKPPFGEGENPVSTKDLVHQIKVQLPHYQDMAQTNAQRLGYRLPPLGRRRRPGVEGKMCFGLGDISGFRWAWYGIFSSYMNGWFSMVNVGRYIYIYTHGVPYTDPMGILSKSLTFYMLILPFWDIQQAEGRP